MPRPLSRFLSRQCGSHILTDKTELWGLIFKNRIGLAAGFDKNARYLRELEVLGFGYVEVGTVTPVPQAGNELPRLFRLPEDQALINRMGFNNDGAAAVAGRIRKWREDQKKRSKQDIPQMIIGGNIGKNKATPNELAWKDYVFCMRELFSTVDYFVVNISSPNTPGLRALQEKDALGEIIDHLQSVNHEKASLLGVQPKPLLIKIAPDLTEEQLSDIVQLAKEKKVSGIVATNTTLDRNGLRPKGQERSLQIGAGGLSGRPLKQRSTEVQQFIRRQAPDMPVIASGGIFDYNDALEKLESGAELLQVWTGFIYEGPLIVRNILRGLSADSGAGSIKPGNKTSSSAGEVPTT
jgi:dihydroorotate dehydrogenase